MRRFTAILACLAGLAGAKPGTAGAQASTPGPPMSLTPDQPHSKQDSALAQQDAHQTLSSRLAQTNGTVRPPAAVDPGMRQIPTTPGTMPVIPPPGTPGGAPGAVAK